MFIDAMTDGAKIQLFVTAEFYKDDFELLTKVKRGDIIGIVGNPGRTKTGELSIRPTKIESLSYCLH